MKAIMISIKPKWCAKIMNGEKTIEVRKNKALANAIQKLVDENGYADIYVYCSKDNKTKLSSNSLQYYVVDNKNYKDYLGNWNGKVLFKFRCYKVEKIEVGTKENTEQKDYSTFYSSIDEMKLFKASCLDAYEILKYVGYCDDFFRAYKYKVYAIHISDLEIFDKPKELNEFHGKGYEERLKRELEYSGDIAGIVSDTVSYWYRIKKAPQNYCYVEIGK